MRSPSPYAGRPRTIPIARAGLPKLRVHDLRHLYVSLLHAQKVPIEVISGLVRHANPQITRTIYLHLRDDTKREAAGRIAHLFSQTGS